LKSLDSLSLRLRQALPFGGKSRETRPGDGGGISETIHRALSSAGLYDKAGQWPDVTGTIEKALSAAGLNQRATGTTGISPTSEGLPRDITTLREVEGSRVDPIASQIPARGGEFLTRSYTNGAGTRTYKLYIPVSYLIGNADAMPMVVMLHGCKQSPDDFAAGTQMNALAEQHGFLVAYPAQAANANGSKCWNWFRTEDQGRDDGEPSLIAGITREVASHYRIDGRRIFVAGLSAGAAMAVILGATYPELYAAVGAHSGLPYAVAHDVPSAFSAMKGGAAPAGLSGPFAKRRPSRPSIGRTVPTIVFHGDSDSTVASSNGDAIVEAMVVATGETGLRVSTQDGATSSGRTYSRTIYADAAGAHVVEHWVPHGSGHAWSGGSSSGSFTDPSGPDASSEMIRFFYAQKRPGTA
jgi:poly(hydroxyalkanoate) depolymerase family esterase